MMKPYYWKIVDDQNIPRDTLNDWDVCSAIFMAEKDEGDPGTVYFLKTDDSESIKIGFTTNLPLRLRHIQTGCPSEVRLLASVEAGRGTELFYHTKWMRHRQRGEWFEPAPAILSEIERIKGGQ